MKTHYFFPFPGNSAADGCLQEKVRVKNMFDVGTFKEAS